MTESLNAYYGLPQKVTYCRRCVMTNQRPSSYPEFRHTSKRRTPTLHIDEQGICDACHFADQKEGIDWEAREKDLLRLLEKHRRNDGGYDCIVSGSGGKDSGYSAHVLKYKYDMHPLTVTWPPIIYTDIGAQNFRNWIEVGGFDNITFKPNGQVHRLLTRLAIEHLLHPFQTFILGQKNLAPKVALREGIQLIFYGENEAEYGNPIADNENSLRDKSYYSIRDLSEIYLGGVSISELTERNELSLIDLMPYLPPNHRDLVGSNIEVHYLGYYLKWTPQEAYYYVVEHTGFEANPERTEGTYSKYSSLDDRIDGLHYYTTYVKFGIGRATYDASQEIRNRHLNRVEGAALVRRFDGEFPERYFHEIMEYLDIDPDHFLELCDNARSPHLWKLENGEWNLRHTLGEAM